MTARHSPARSWRIAALIVAISALAVVALWRLPQRTEFTAPRREGPPAWVAQPDGQAELWLLVKLEQRRLVFGERLDTLYHLELRAHDPATGHVRWRRRLRTVSEHEDGHGLRGRILGQDGERVWVFVHDRPIALAARDGAVRASVTEILAHNPALQGQLPTTLEQLSFDAGLVMIAADGRRLRIAGTTLDAQPYQPASEQAYSQQRFMASQWNGGFEARQFLTPQLRLDAQRWFGLYTDAEAKAAGHDPWGDHLKQPARTWRDDKQARRALHTARLGRTRVFSEGSHERLFDVQRVQGSPEYLQGGFVVNAGTTQPLLLDGGDVLVLHRTRIDAAGRAVLARIGVDDGVQTRWQATLPFSELRNRWQGPERLLLYGELQGDAPGYHTRFQEVLAAVELASGRVHGWNITLERPLDGPLETLPPSPTGAR